MRVVTKLLEMKNIVAYLRNLNKAYIEVSKEIYETNYLPIIEQFDIKPNAGIKFRYFKTDGKSGITTNVSKDIDPLDSGDESTRFLSLANKNRYLIDRGDLILGPSFVVLNFTNEPITVYDHLNNHTVFHPLEQNKLLKAAEGKIVVFAIHHITTPINHSLATGVKGNYLKEYLDHYNFNPAKIDGLPYDKFNQSLKLRYFAAKAWDSFQEIGEDLNVPDIKVISMGVLTPRVFVDEATEEEVSVFFRDVDLYFTKSKNFTPIINPACSRNSEFMEMKKNIVPGTPCIFMVDPDNEIKPKYYAIHNRVHMVPKINSLSREKGLWIAKFDKDFNIVEDYHVPIDKINELDFLFDHQDEAKQACNFREKREKELKEMEAYLKEKENEFKLKMSQFEYESKMRIKKMEEEHIEFKHKLEREALKFKAEFEERKYARDYSRYEQNYLIESLKTFAAISSVVASCFVIMKQISKS